MHPQMIMGAAAKIYSQGLSDSVLWNKHIYPIFANGLRELLLIGEPVWTNIGAVRYYQVDEAERRVIVKLNGAWFNWLKATQQGQWPSMRDVPADASCKAKLAMKRINWQGKRLALNLEGQRLTLYTQGNNLLGFVAKEDNLKILSHPHWQIVNASSQDGNLTAILAAV
jgi:hypothetical protein